MKNKIKDTFYDKEVSILSKTQTIDAEGGIVKGSLEVIDTFMGNVNFSNCKKIQEEYGLDYQIDVAITTDKMVNIDDVIEYLSVKYTVTDVMPTDSHILILASKWQI